MSDTAESQALAQVESIAAMVAALNVDYERLEELRGERADFLTNYEPPSDVIGGEKVPCDYDPSAIWSEENPEDAVELAELEKIAGENTSEDDAREAIECDALSVEVRSGWARTKDEFEADEFRIVLCTGGPHVEIVGDLDRGTPSRVRVLYRDWGTSGELFDFDHDAVSEYCEQFYFGE